MVTAGCSNAYPPSQEGALPAPSSEKLPLAHCPVEDCVFRIDVCPYINQRPQALEITLALFLTHLLSKHLRMSMAGLPTASSRE